MTDPDQRIIKGEFMKAKGRIVLFLFTLFAWSLTGIGSNLQAQSRECLINERSIITTVTGNGTPGFSGDGGPALGAQLYDPWDVTAYSTGNLYIADSRNHRIRKVDTTTGIVSTFAGNGTDGFSGDGGSALSAQLHGPTGVTVDSSGNLYVADINTQSIRKVDAMTGIISTFAGNGTPGFSGDGGPATSAQLSGPAGVTVDSTGNLYIADQYNNRIRKVDTAGIISTFAGSGRYPSGSEPISSGDGGPATGALFIYPSNLAVDRAGNVYIAGNFPGWLNDNSVRKVDATTGIITTVAGNGRFYSGAVPTPVEGGSALSAQLNRVHGLAVDSTGNLYIAESASHRVRKVDPRGIITTVAGNGTPGYSGDGGPAISAQLYEPIGITVDIIGNLYIADSSNQRVRKVTCLSTSGRSGTTPELPPPYHLPEKFPGTDPNPPDPALKTVVTPSVKK